MFISVIIAGIIILLLPNQINKYTLEIIDQEPLPYNSQVYFEDLDGDNLKEKIIALPNTLKLASLMIYDSGNNIIDQWNLQSYFPQNAYKELHFLDYDANGYKEIYSVTQIRDSAFLYITEPLKSNGVTDRLVFLDTIGNYNGIYDLNPTNSIKLLKVPDRKEKKVVFSSNAGFTGYPRMVFSYDITWDTLNKSPHLTNKSTVYDTGDFNNDGEQEILLKSISACNEINHKATSKSDCICWISVLDQNLNFLFPQIEFQYPYATVVGIIPQNEKLIYILNSKRKSQSPITIYSAFYDGTVKTSYPINFPANKSFIDLENKKFHLFSNISGLIETYDFELNKVNSHVIDPFVTLSNIQLDSEGDKEWITFDDRNGIFSVYQSDFKHPVSINTAKDIPLNFGLKDDINKNIIWFQSGNDLIELNYIKNPWYYMQYLLYLAIYGIVLGSVLGIMKIQSHRERQKQKLENQIAELQLKTIKNQVDPHFLFNAMNTIGALTLMENKNEADQFISEFSTLMRRTLEGSDKIAHNLKEELDYVDSFVRLKKIRYMNKFGFLKEVDEKVKLTTVVPKHVVYTFVENAIKHGMASNSYLQIKCGALSHPKGTLLYIEDNAGGTGNSVLSDSLSTGSGLQIIEQIFELYTRLTRGKVSHKLNNLIDDDGKISGLRVEILIRSND